MPIYEYYCNECRNTFSALRPMSQADELIVCTGCNSVQTHRILSLFAVRVAGSSPATSSAGGCGCGGMCSCRN